MGRIPGEIDRESFQLHVVPLADCAALRSREVRDLLDLVSLGEILESDEVGGHGEALGALSDYAIE